MNILKWTPIIGLCCIGQVTSDFVEGRVQEKAFLYTFVNYHLSLCFWVIVGALWLLGII